ncbi:MAG: amidohydrolase family protein [Chloroflexi bacterium]|nr:amidohydrolase family protein [Chloroflexota bacterium]MCL5074069.1 amidohydrolase family protein [Chloroflexota bacterium]
MSLLVKGKYILTGVGKAKAEELISDGAVYVEKGQIIEVGPYNDLVVKYKAPEIGSTAHLVIPGLVNAHDHGRGLTLTQLGMADDPLELLLLGLRGSPIDPYLTTLLAGMQQIESGITTTMHCPSPCHPSTFESNLERAIAAYEQLGLRVGFAIPIKNQNFLVYGGDDAFLSSLPMPLARQARALLEEFSVPSPEEYFAIFDHLYRRHMARYPRIKVLFYPVGPQWCSDELLQAIKARSKDLGAGIHLHLLETMYQGIYGLKKYGQSLVELLNGFGFLDSSVTCAHCVWLSERDIEILAHNRVSVVHNPSSNLRLRSGTAPVIRLLDKGVNVAIGLDGITIDDDTDILQEMRLCCRLQNSSPGMVSLTLRSEQSFRMATVNGIKAVLGTENIGTIQPGKRADLVLLRLEEITAMAVDAEQRIVELLVMRGKSAHVDTVIIDGEVVLREGILTKVDKRQVLAEFTDALRSAGATKQPGMEELVTQLKGHLRKYYEEWESWNPNPVTSREAAYFQ